MVLSKFDELSLLKASDCLGMPRYFGEMRCYGAQCEDDCSFKETLYK